MASSCSNDNGASATAGVCCMCGDQGLPGELFQCGLCLQRRLQHRYCSNQYPRISAYPICNWCLRDKQQVGGGPSPAAVGALTTTARAKQRPPTASRLKNGSRGHHDNKDRRPCGGSGGDGCSRSSFQAEPQKPVKKPKETRAVQRPEATTAAKGVEAPTAGARKPPPPFRAKARVRRYKLLAESPEAQAMPRRSRSLMEPDDRC